MGSAPADFMLLLSLFLAILCRLLVSVLGTYCLIKITISLTKKRLLCIFTTEQKDKEEKKDSYTHKSTSDNDHFWQSEVCTLMFILGAPGKPELFPLVIKYLKLVFSENCYLPHGAGWISSAKMSKAVEGEPKWRTVVCKWLTGAQGSTRTYL